MYFRGFLLVTGLAIVLSPLSAVASPLLFFNEFHYDNVGIDSGEGLEVAGRAGTLTDGWTVQFYNGGTGVVYRTIILSGTIGDQDNGFGTLYFETGGLQNGAPDGLALVNEVGVVQQFLSYEGSFVATTGFAAGMTSTDIGVHEPTDTPVGWSLQLAGRGQSYDDFNWTDPAISSFGVVNAGQSFATVPIPGAAGLLAGALISLGGLRRKR